MLQLEDIKTLVVVGSGVMGRGIAIVGLQAGFRVVLYDIQQDYLDEARKYIESFTQKSVEKQKLTAEARGEMLERLTYTPQFEDMVGEFVIEAILENRDLKWDVFRRLEAQNAPETILTTNTSSLSVTEIASCLDKPERFAGMHFFNPAPLMKLVEVIAGAQTDPRVPDLVDALTRKMRKSPAHVQDIPGFIVNRVARHFYLESLRILEERIASQETIDEIMEATGFRMGPFRLMDLIGVDTNHEVTKSIYAGYFQEPRFRPSRIQQKMVEAGYRGRKSGRGFYDYSQS